MRKLWIILFLMALTAFPLGAQVDFDHPDILSFESGRGSSADHSKLGTRSLKWTWKRNGAELSLKHRIPYLKDNLNKEETSVSSFVFWVYSPDQMKGSIRFEFLKQGRVCCGFSYRLGFTGWRGAWVAFDRDMEGRPEEGMDEILIRIEGPRKGTLYFDGIIPAVFEDIRYHTPDLQAQYINTGTKVHWLRLLEFWQRTPDISIPAEISEEDRTLMETIRERFIELIAGKGKGFGLEKARKALEASRKPIFFTRYGETYLNLGIIDASERWRSNGQLLRTYNDNLFQIALSYRSAKDPAAKAELAEIYLELTRHLLDEGFAAGSGQGTLHHLGYSMRNFYTAPIIMRDVLREAGLLNEVQQAMEWFSGAGEVKTAPESPGMDIDAFNTYLLGRLAAVILLEDSPYKYTYLKCLSRWIDNGFKISGGTKAGFKTDGTVFHHRKAYPAYAVGGFDGAVKAVWLLHGTPFAVSEESHLTLKRALLEMRFYCNQASFPLALSGRHPDGLGALIPEQYGLLSEAGTPDGMEEIDPELAAAYMRLSGETERTRRFASQGIVPELSPTGVKIYSYNCSMSVRQDSWLVTIAGHSRYLWSTEIYQGANHYGRYLTHGSMEILCGDNPVSSHGSGYQIDGYDWCHIPGTTAAPLPMHRMKAHVINPDTHSGYEEMLLSDEWFAGGISDGDVGAFAMKLHEHDKYNGSLRARKSWFVSGNRIVCLGSNIESDIPVNTTLFQNALEAPVPADSTTGETLLRDRFGNTWILQEGTAVHTRRLQHSLHEETDKPTAGWFEKAYIRQDGPTYEYLTLVQPESTQVDDAVKIKPYRVIQRSSSIHAVAMDGYTYAAVFEQGPVDSLIAEASACVLMYRREGSRLRISVCNPDLALYSGPADEIYDASGKRVERSVYSRSWIDNDCLPTMVSLTLDGLWSIVTAPEGTICRNINGKSFITIPTAEARTETIVLQ